MSSTPWTGNAASQFNRQRKKFDPAIQRVVIDQMARLLQDPHRAELKAGAFRGHRVWVTKFQAVNDQYLLAFVLNEKERTVTFVAVGQHENFYRDLKRYLGV